MNKLVCLVALAVAALLTSCSSAVAPLHDVAPHGNANFSFIQITDPHVDSNPFHLAQFEKAVQEINGFKPDFVVVTGDLVLTADAVWSMKAKEWYGNFDTIVTKLTMPVYYAIGNHDLVDTGSIGARINSDTTKNLYRELYGPTYYSFDWGLWHALVLDPNELEGGHLVIRIPEEEARWIKQDLAAVPDNKPLLVFVHEPSSTWGNRDEVIGLFGNRRVLIYAGHWHENTIKIEGNIIERTTGALSGSPLFNNGVPLRPDGTNYDGTPPGYRVVIIEGESVESFYRGIL